MLSNCCNSCKSDRECMSLKEERYCMSKAEKDKETQTEKKQDERSKRKEDRHHEYPSAGIKHAGSLIEQGYRVEGGN